MSDVQQRIVEAEQARLAWDRYVGPALGVIRAAYLERLTAEAEKPMEGRALAAVQSLSLAIRVTREVEGQIRSVMFDGEAAKADFAKAGAIARMGPEAQRYAQY